jgi:hypothetical protein
LFIDVGISAGVYTSIEFIDIPTVGLKDCVGVEWVTPIERIVLNGVKNGWQMNGPQDLHGAEGIACMSV